MITLSRNDDIATLTLARPDKRNALTTEMLQALESYANEVSRDERTRVVIIRGAGDHFSVGADLEALNQQTSRTLLQQRIDAEAGAEMLRSIREIRQPVIAAIQGVATGGGACIATACDFRIATDSARLGYGEINMAMNLMWHALPLCVQLVGPARAKRLIMSGQLFDAATLESWGFIDAVTSFDALDDTVMQWATHYAALPPMAVQMIKRSINHCAGALDHAVMHADADQWLLAANSADFEEAVSAFFEKRQPHFNGN